MNPLTFLGCLDRPTVRRPAKGRDTRRPAHRLALARDLVPLETRAVPAVVSVTPTSLGDWASRTTGTPNTASVTFVTGPATPPLGNDSLQLATGANGDGAAEFRNRGLAGTRLGDITDLSYSTYVSQYVDSQAPYIILAVDFDGNGTSDDLLFFEPVYQGGSFNPNLPAQGPVQLNTWQTWDAAAGGWWSVNNTAGASPGTGVKSLADIVAAAPNAAIVNTASGLGGFRFVAGFGAGAWNNFVGHVDNVTIGVGGGTTTYDFDINDTPAAGALSVTPNLVAENGTVDLSGQFVDADAGQAHTVVINWGDGSAATTLNLPAGTNTFAASHQYLDDNPTGTASDAYQVVVTVTDGQGASDTAGATVTVTNAPVVVGPVGGPATGAPLQPLTFSVGFTDAGTLDTHEVSWDFGDGTVIAFHPTTDPGALAPTHTYATPGTRTVRVTVRDDDGSVATAERQVMIGSVALQDDPVYPGKQALVVGGTARNDRITFTWISATRVGAFRNGTSLGQFSTDNLSRLVAFGGAGRDRIVADPRIAVNVQFHGGTGADTLTGANGDDILVGDEGNDWLVGRWGRDVLIGGLGADRLQGGVITRRSGEDSDLLIAGHTNHDASDVALNAIHTEWTSGQSLLVRAARLSEGTGGLPALNTSTVHGDGSRDRLYGGNGPNWSFLTAGQDLLLRWRVGDATSVEGV